MHVDFEVESQKFNKEPPQRAMRQNVEHLMLFFRILTRFSKLPLFECILKRADGKWIVSKWNASHLLTALCGVEPSCIAH